MEIYDKESIEDIFGAIGLQVNSLERFPSFDLEFDLEGQYCKALKILVRLDFMTWKH